MADINYSVGVETARANANLNKLKTNIKSTSSSFNGLRNAIAAVGAAALITNAFAMANSMRDLSQATGIALENIVGFSNALAANGGTIDRARDGLTDLVKNIGEAARGSSELQYAFRQAGISIQDLARLSEQDILRGVVAGLERIPDSATRTSVALKLFGESFKGVDVSGLNADLDQFIIKSAKTAEGINKAGQASQNFKNSFNDFQNQLLQALLPLSELAVAILSSTEAVGKFINIALKIGIAVASFTLIGKAAGIAAAAIRGLASVPGLVTGAFAGLSRTFGSLATQFRAVFRSGRVTGQTVTGLGKRAKHASEEIGMLGKALAYIGTAAYAGYEGLKAFFGFGGTNEVAKETRNIFDEQQKIAAQQARINEKAREEAEIRRQVVDAMRQQVDAIVKIQEGFEKKNSLTIDALRTEKKNLSLTQEQIRYNETIANFQQQHNEQIQTLTDKYKELNREPKKNAELLEQVKKSMALLNEEYAKQAPLVEKIAGGILEAKVAEEARQKALEISTQKAKELADAVTEASQASKDFALNMSQSTKDAQNELAMLNMDELAKSIFKIKTGISRDISTEVRKLQALIDETGDPNGAIKQQIDSITAAGQQAIQAQSELAMKSYQYQRSWSYGWSKAFKDYQSDATNSAKRAASVFSKATKGMEDSIVSFAKTGKFEWKGFVSSILEELLRAQIQQTIAQVFGAASPPRLGGSGSSGGGGLGSVIDGIGSLFGGSSAPSKSSGGGGFMDTISSIGSSIGSIFGGSKAPSKSSGGGFMDTISSIGSSIGSIFGGSKSPAKSSGGGFMDSISGAVSGVGKFFSGFFANGGMIPAGGYGIVGERGPEMVSGPGMVTPMSGGTNVTYNINAVDASSFASLVARDPGLIYAVTEQGRRSLATRR